MTLKNHYVRRPNTWKGRGKSWLFGMVLDKRRGWKIQPSPANSEYPEVYKQLQDLMKTHDEHFSWTTINVNLNIRCKDHVDKGNLGDSIIVGLGDYQGGEFVLKKTPIPLTFSSSPPPIVPICRHETKYNIKRNFVRFCAKSQKHATEPFTGNRLSIT